MIIKIVAAGTNEFEELYTPDANELLVGVDGGIYNIINIGKEVDLAVGDFDSCNIEEVVLHCKNIRVFPKDKDYGDLELAILEVKDLEFSKIELYNVTGGRLDHYHSALNLIIKYLDLNIEIIDKNNRIKTINQSMTLKKSDCKYVSIFAIDENVRVSLTGFKYNLNNYLLNRMDNVGLSNEIIDETAKIEINDKRILLFRSK